MLNQIEVPGSTSVKINNPKAKTDNVRPLAWMALLFVFSLFGLVIGVKSLQKFQPTGIPLVNQFLLTEGTHRWLLKENEQCQGYVVGGWKKRRNLGERVWFKFNIPARHGVNEQIGEINAKFGDYKNLESLTGYLNGSPISFDGKVWSSNVPQSSKELVLMVDGPSGTKLLKLPTPWNRDFDRFLGRYINEKRRLDEVDKDEFRKCVKELKQ